MLKTPDLATQITDFCTKIAANPLLVQGAGGNVSWKDSKALNVTTSGSWLATAATQQIFVAVDYAHLQQAINNQDFTVTPRVIANTSLRPSIETLLHAVLPHKVVVHLHAVEILAHLVRDAQAQRLQRLLPEPLTWSYVPYCKPGAALAAAVAAALQQRPATTVFFLGNHGVVLGAETIASIEVTLNKLLMLLQNPVQHFAHHARQSQYEAEFSARGYSPCHDNKITQLATAPQLLARLPQEWALYPDHIVFLGAQAAIFEPHFTLKDLAKLIGKKPPFIFAIGSGVFKSSRVTAAQLFQLHCYYNILIRQPAATKLVALNKEQIAAILNWEAEQYRQQHGTPLTKGNNSCQWQP